MTTTPQGVQVEPRFNVAPGQANPVIIAGEDDKPTPQLQAPIYRLVANPTWTVPKGIGENELAKKSPQWLADNVPPRPSLRQIRFPAE